jgi:hypothetical protein
MKSTLLENCELLLSRSMLNGIHPSLKRRWMNQLNQSLGGDVDAAIEDLG